MCSGLSLVRWRGLRVFGAPEYSENCIRVGACSWSQDLKGQSPLFLLRQVGQENE
jgi:hypothetical protein